MDQFEKYRDKDVEINEALLNRRVEDLPPRSHRHPKPKSVLKTPVYLFLIGIIVIVIGVIIYSAINFFPFKTKETATDPNSGQIENSEKGQTPALNPKPDEQNETKPEEGQISPSTPNQSKDQTNKVEKDEPKPERPEDKKEPVKEPVKETPKSDQKIVTYKVQEGDTLFSISMKFYGNQTGIAKIKEVNGLKTDEIFEGTTIKIPNPTKNP